MSDYITAYICKTANLFTHVTASFHVAPICNIQPSTSHRVSKSGRHADARLRNIFHKLRKILDFKRETEKLPLLT